MGETLEIRVLGPVEALVGGEQRALGGTRQRSLLALLLVRGTAVSSELLAEDLWQGAPPAGAGTTLRSYVSRLRTALAADFVRGERGSYALATDEVALDAARFEALLSEGRQALARGAAGLAADRLGAALSLWRGAAYADVRDCEPVEAEGRRLDELRLECLELRIEADLALGRERETIGELQALVRAEPLRERLWRHLVLALYRAGRQAEALAAYREARDLLDRELGLQPSEELRELERAILRHEVDASAPPEERSNLPAPPTRLVGREAEVAALERLLREHRLVTISGLGGSGKTRLALEVAARQVGTWADGVWLVDLTAVGDAALVLPAAASALGVDPADALVDRLRDREQLLLLDNCEHLLDGAAELAAQLLRGCPHVRVLATSRVTLGLPGEVDFALDPLPFSEAVELFDERVLEVRPAAAAGDRDAVERICRELEGLPLALELAAARANVLSLAEIAERLDDRLRFLRAWRRIAEPRHRTLETTMDWSYDLLDPDERRLLRRLGAFAGGADLAAVSVVCLDGDEERAVELLGRLAAASLVRVDLTGPTRYRLLETVRQYAAARLAEDPDADAVARAHAEHYLRVAEGANLSIDRLGFGPQEPAIVLREQHNVRAALDWAAGHDVELGLRLAISVENFWVTQAVPEWGVRLQDLLDRAAGVDPAVLAAAHRDRGASADVLGDIVLAEQHYRRSRALYADLGDRDGVASLDFRLGLMAKVRGDLDTAWRLFRESHAVFRETGYRIGLIQALGGLAELEIEDGDEELGLQLAEESLALAREAGWHWWVSRALADRAEYAAQRGRADEAEAKGRPFLEYAWQTSNRQETLFGLAILARAAAARGHEERARALWATVAASDAGVGRFGSFDRAEYAAAMPPGELPEPLPLADAVALALS
ncbi:MAG TPA: BTAD domain-containing putative transcriptional regulator [Gaiellaceae bacterium]|nr:BTAD domain-containing putative transcriptional regulator [Gaiellaceae bacterium]